VWPADHVPYGIIWALPQGISHRKKKKELKRRGARMCLDFAMNRSLERQRIDDYVLKPSCTRLKRSLSAWHVVGCLLFLISDAAFRWQALQWPFPSAEVHQARIPINDVSNLNAE
jgi:hypothetical protein